jgi:hypothetical protein
MQLHGVWKPSLEAATYTVTATQKIKAFANDDEKVINNYLSTDTTKTVYPQVFTVVAPQFSLPANSINSYYPPDGHQDEGRVLPHIVLDDPVECPSNPFIEQGWQILAPPLGTTCGLNWESEQSPHWTRAGQPPIARAVSPSTGSLACCACVRSGRVEAYDGRGC